MELKRKELVTHPRLQAKWLGIFLTLVALSTILVYVSIDRSIAQASASGNDLFLSGDWIRQRIQTPFFFASLLALIAAGLVAMYQLHTLLGPLKALETALGRLQRGDLSQPFYTRSGDELQDLALSVRSMQEGLRARVLKDREKAGTLKAIVDTAIARLPPGPSKIKEDLQFVAKELESLTTQFEL